MSTTRRFSAFWWSLVLVVIAGCSNLDPRDIVVSRRPMEQLSATMDQYKRKLPQDDGRALQAFIARAELEASVAGNKTDVVGKRLHQVLKIQQDWAAAQKAPSASEAPGLDVEVSLEELDQGHYPNNEMWPNWLVDRVQITTQAQNGTKAPIKSISGVLIAEDSDGNAVAAVSTELTVPDEVGAIAAGKSQSWTFIVEIDRYAPCEAVEEGGTPEWAERSSKIGEAFQGFLTAHDILAREQSALTKLEEADGTLQEELTSAREDVAEATKAREKAASQAQAATGHDEPGQIISGVDGRGYYVPTESLEICPTRDTRQVIQASFITGLTLRWITTDTAAGEPNPNATAEPATPPAEPTGPAASENTDAGATAPEPDGGAAEAPTDGGSAEPQPDATPAPASTGDAAATPAPTGDATPEAPQS